MCREGAGSEQAACIPGILYFRHALCCPVKGRLAYFHTNGACYMSLYQALYRKYRPQRFEDVYGQEHITSTLVNQLVHDQVMHAYMFTGTRGTGKTTCAKLLARAVNCEHPVNGSPCNECRSCRSIIEAHSMDVTELDAASNTGVDNIRSILDETAYPPSELKKRVYIIDEVHMLSIGAFNALLKTLEEPPEYVLFILATTEIQKVPATILSRCQRFDFRRVDVQTLSANLQKIIDAEGISITPEAVGLIARLGDGSVRDSLSILERCVSEAGEKTIELADIERYFGIADFMSVYNLSKSIASYDTAEALRVLDSVYSSGRDMRSLVSNILSLLRDTLIYKTAGEASATLLSPSTDISSVQTLSSMLDRERIILIIDKFRSVLSELGRTVTPRLSIELAIIELCNPSSITATGAAVPDALIARLNALESAVASGSAPIVKRDAPQKKVEPIPATAEHPVHAPLPKDGLSTAQLKDLTARLSGKIPRIAEVYIISSGYEIDGNNLTISTEGDFEREILNGSDVKSAIAAALNEMLGIKFNISVKAGDSADSFSGFDSIISNAKDSGIDVK